MKRSKSPRFGLVLLILASHVPCNAQTLDWGSWGTDGTATYSNGDSITITSQSNGSVDPVFNETSTPHVFSDPAFPFANAPGDGEYGFFHNAAPSTAAWSVVIDLTDFSLTPTTVIGFANLDSKSPTGPQNAFAVIQFLDASNTPVSIASASFLGSFNYTWQGVEWDANSSFDLNTGRWDVVPGSSTAHSAGSYYGAVGDAFFLTNLPTGIEKIAYYKSSTNYAYDSTLFYAGHVVPEPSSTLMAGLASLGLALRRKRHQG